MACQRPGRRLLSFSLRDLAYRIIVTARAISSSVTVVITPVAESEIRQDISLFKIETPIDTGIYRSYVSEFKHTNLSMRLRMLDINVIALNIFGTNIAITSIN